jgi:hypothetical protein
MRSSEPRNPDPKSFENAGLNEPNNSSLCRLFRLRLKRGADSVFSPDVSFESSSRGPIAFHAHRVVRGVIEGKKYDDIWDANVIIEVYRANSIKCIFIF